MAKKKAKAPIAGAGETTEVSANAKPQAEALLHQQSVEARLVALKERVEELRKENAKLKLQGEKSEKDTHEFVAYFQREMEKKEGVIAGLNEKMTEQQLRYETQLRESRDRYEQELQETRAVAGDTQEDLESRLKRAEEELAVLQEYKHEKNSLLEELQETKTKLQRSHIQHEQSMLAMERKCLEEKARNQKEMERQIEEIKNRAREEAQKGLDADTRKIIVDNRRMGEELHFQLQTTDELQRQGKQLSEENKRLSMELSLASEKGKEYANQGYRKETELREAKNKIKSLERSLSKLIREFEHEKQAIVQKNHQANRELELEVSGLRQLVKLKNKELNNVRHLAQVVLDQRTDVEHYFLEALEQVKSEIQKKREETYRKRLAEYRKQMRMAHANPGTTKFPAIKAPHQLYPGEEEGDFTALHAARAGAKVDLRDLSWEDRERVLRLLFAKINAVQNQSHDVLSDSVKRSEFGLGNATWEEDQQQRENGSPRTGALSRFDEGKDASVFDGNQPPSLLGQPNLA